MQEGPKDEEAEKEPLAVVRRMTPEHAIDRMKKLSHHCDRSLELRFMPALKQLLEAS